MDWLKLEKLFNEVIKEYEKSEMFSIMCYSTNHSRDISILQERVKGFRKHFKDIKKDGTDVNSSETGSDIGEENLQKEFL